MIFSANLLSGKPLEGQITGELVDTEVTKMLVDMELLGCW